MAIAAYMAANTHSPTPGASLKKNNAAAPLEHSSVFATASVGRGDWASEVLQNVVGGGNEETGSVTSTQASTAPPPTLSAEEQLKLVLLQKKRLFHSNRCLELKNLPEGVTEQVNIGHNLKTTIFLPENKVLGFEIEMIEMLQHQMLC